MGLGFARGAQGRLDEARELLDQSAAILERLHPVKAMETWFFRGRFELWAGKSDAAERALRRACELGEVPAGMGRCICGGRRRRAHIP